MPDRYHCKLISVCSCLEDEVAMKAPVHQYMLVHVHEVECHEPSVLLEVEPNLCHQDHPEPLVSNELVETV